MATGSPAICDPFGAALLDHLERGESGIHVLERDDGYVDVASAAIYFGDIPAWTTAEAELIEAASGRVLDIGAGAGRASLHLQGLGTDVTALDVSPGAIDVCRRRGVAETRLGTIAELAAEEPGGFDTFLLFGNNLGLLGSPLAAPGWLDSLRRLARGKARIIGTTLDPYATEDPDHLRYHEWNRTRGRMPGQVTLRTRYRGAATDWFDLLWTSFEELHALTEPLGWEPVSHLQDGPLQTVVLEMR